MTTFEQVKTLHSGLNEPLDGITAKDVLELLDAVTERDKTIARLTKDLRHMTDRVAYLRSSYRGSVNCGQSSGCYLASSAIKYDDERAEEYRKSKQEPTP